MQSKDSDQPSDFSLPPSAFIQSELVEVRYVANRGKGGRGVFARRAIAEGDVFERSPVLLIPKEQVFGDAAIARKAGVAISWYVFTWIHPTDDLVALCLGYGSIYNHSETPNARYQMTLPDVMEFVTVRDIAAGEEILINYRGDAGGRTDLGFPIDPTPAALTPAD